MTLGDRSREQLQAHLASRSDALAQRWYQALLTTGFSRRGTVALRREIDKLFVRIVVLLLADPPEHEAAQQLGAKLVELGFRSPAALARTQDVLGRELVSDLPAEQLANLHPRLIGLLSDLAAGFYRQAEATIQVVQEEIRTAQEAVEEWLRAVVENAPIILFTIDGKGMITLAEGRGLAPIGRRAEELVERSIWENALTNPQLPAYFQRALAGESFTVLVCVRGTVFETHYAPRRKQGAIVGVIGVATDITERARAEAVVRCVELGLTARERRVLPLLVQPELHYDDIGELLHLEPESVRSYAKAIADKLGVSAKRPILAGAIREHGLLLPC